MDEQTTGQSVVPWQPNLRGASAAEVAALRLQPSEAVILTTAMMDGYAVQPANVAAYITRISEVLLEFPRCVALKCMSAVHGVARAHPDYLPTSGQVANWCTREGAWLERALVREQRYARDRLPALPSVDEETRQRVGAGLKQLAETMRADCERANELRRAAIVDPAKPEKNDRDFFEREYLVAGLEPPTHELAPTLYLTRLIERQTAKETQSAAAVAETQTKPS